MRNTLRTLLDRIIKKEASNQEINVFDKFIHYSQKSGNEIPKGIKKKIWNNVREATFDKPTQRLVFPQVWKIAASVALIVGVAFSFYLFSLSEPEINYITKSTSRGQKATITLSDGSTVRLNSESSITFPESFASLGSRDIKLTGEVFFDVKRDETKPFTIRTGDLLTTVLGTSFNIFALPNNDNIEVTVVAGKVSVSPSGGDKGEEKVQVLTPGQQATFNKSSKELTMKEIDLKQFTTWKDGILYLSHKEYKQVFEDLSRWYGVSFEFANNPSEEWDYSGEFKDMSLELVLETIGYASGFEFQILEDKVIIEFEK